MTHNSFGKDTVLHAAEELWFRVAQRFRAPVQALFSSSALAAEVVLCSLGALLILLTLLAPHATAQTSTAAGELLLKLDPTHSGADITLAASFHTVEGTFALKSGTIRYQPATGTATGEIVCDAASGKTGNDRRDRTMHTDVLESRRYPEIVFRPARAEGTLASSGQSTLRVHGLFSIHGADHEVTIPVEINVQGNTWSAQVTLTVPYHQWGMKKPSVLLLRVSDEVQVRVHAAGSLTQ